LEAYYKILWGLPVTSRDRSLLQRLSRGNLRLTKHNISDNNLFSIEEVACLGCCYTGSVVQIDGKTYGHVKPNMTAEILKDFLSFTQGETGNQRRKKMNMN
jgi:(2Fe-2S) ferredoxin